MRRIFLSLFSHRFLAIARWELYFIRLRLVGFLIRQRMQIKRSLASRSESVYLNVGSGPRGLSDHRWINIDGFNDVNVHFLVDLTRSLPFPNNTFDGVFCEHVLEHFSWDEGTRLAREIFRILKPQGVFRIIVPDARIIVKTYLEDPKALVSYRVGVSDAFTAMEVVNLFFRQRYEHQFIYDFETMKKMLFHVGFQDVDLCSFGNARFCSAIVLDDEKYSWESLYVEARKSC